MHSVWDQIENMLNKKKSFDKKYINGLTERYNFI